MADTNLLAALLSGSNPLAPQMLGGYQGAQLSDAALNPTFAHNEGPFGALAKTIAGFSGGDQLRQAIEATTAARQGANPDLARMLAANDPFAAAGQPSANPIAAAQILAGATPQSAAEARLHSAQAALANAQLPVLGSLAQPRPSTALGAGGAVTPLATAPAASIGGLTSGRPAPTDSLTEIANLAPEQRADAIAKVTDPRARAALMARLARMRGANAARP
jgi:hypothetical protein